MIGLQAIGHLEVVARAARGDLADIIRGGLIHVVVQPVREEQMSMPAPAHLRNLGGIIVRIVIPGQPDRQAFLDIPVIFAFQSQWIVFRMPGDIKMPAIFGGDDIHSSFVRFRKQIHRRTKLNIGTPDFSVPRMRRVEEIIKAAQQSLILRQEPGVERRRTSWLGAGISAHHGGGINQPEQPNRC